MLDNGTAGENSILNWIIFLPIEKAFSGSASYGLIHSWVSFGLLGPPCHCSSRGGIAILLLSSALFDRVPLSPNTFSCITGLLLNRRLVSLLLSAFHCGCWWERGIFWNISPCGLAFPLDCYAQDCGALGLDKVSLSLMPLCESLARSWTS